jgi:hypothetical protein
MKKKILIVEDEFVVANDQGARNWLKHAPEFIQRFPQNMIASYLGLSPETLSRIGKHMVNK